MGDGRKVIKVVCQSQKCVIMSEIEASTEEILEKIKASNDPPRSAVRYLYKGNEDYDWVGIYVLIGDELVIGPFLGPPTPHTRIDISKGICGAAVREERIINLPDVWADDRFIACSTTTRSELVVPIWHENKIVAEIDIDSNRPAVFSKKDEILVDRIARLIAPYIENLAEKLS